MYFVVDLKKFQLLFLMKIVNKENALLGLGETGEIYIKKNFKYLVK